MCRLFISADPSMWDTRLRSVLALHGFATSVRLENIYWLLLEEIARRDGLSVAEILARLYEELLDAHGAVENFASFLRVCCVRYLMLQLAGDISTDLRQPIAGTRRRFDPRARKQASRRQGRRKRGRGQAGDRAPGPQARASRRGHLGPLRIDAAVRRLVGDEYFKPGARRDHHAAIFHFDQASVRQAAQQAADLLREPKPNWLIWVWVTAAGWPSRAMPQALEEASNKR